MTSTDEDVIEEAYQEAIKEMFGTGVFDYPDMTRYETRENFTKGLKWIRLVREIALEVIRENPKAIKSKAHRQMNQDGYEING